MTTDPHFAAFDLDDQAVTAGWAVAAESVMILYC